jgi:hypothetical protein
VIPGALNNDIVFLIRIFPRSFVTGVVRRMQSH